MRSDAAYHTDHTSTESHTIAEMSRVYNVTYRTLRFYEQSGLLKPMRAGANRFYSPRDCQILQIVLAGKKFGLSLREIGDIIEPYLSDKNVEKLEPRIDTLLGITKIERQISLLEQQKADITDAIEELKAALTC